MIAFGEAEWPSWGLSLRVICRHSERSEEPLYSSLSSLNQREDSSLFHLATPYESHEVTAHAQ